MRWLFIFYLVYFYKQKRAYEVRISDWNSDVCSSDLFWNVIGNQWEQSIGEMNVRVTAPADVTRVACFQGTFGSTAECNQAQITKKGDAVFSQSNLPAFEDRKSVV